MVVYVLAAAALLASIVAVGLATRPVDEAATPGRPQRPTARRLHELPESTVVHSHGVDLPNAMDGVPDITQPPVKPGGTFTYEFTAQSARHCHILTHAEREDGMFGMVTAR